MSVSNPANSLIQSAAANDTSLPTEPHERRREAGISKAGSAPDSVGNQSFDQTLGRRSWHRRLAIPRLLVLLALPAALFAAEQLTAPAAKVTQEPYRKVSWYFQSGQWIADVRTLRAACQFLLADEPNETIVARR